MQNHSPLPRSVARSTFFQCLSRSPLSSNDPLYKSEGQFAGRERQMVWVNGKNGKRYQMHHVAAQLGVPAISLEANLSDDRVGTSTVPYARDKNEAARNSMKGESFSRQQQLTRPITEHVGEEALALFSEMTGRSLSLSDMSHQQTLGMWENYPVAATMRLTPPPVKRGQNDERLSFGEAVLVASLMGHIAEQDAVFTMQTVPDHPDALDSAKSDMEALPEGVARGVGSALVLSLSPSSSARLLNNPEQAQALWNSIYEESGGDLMGATLTPITAPDGTSQLAFVIGNLEEDPHGWNEQFVQDNFESWASAAQKHGFELDASQTATTPIQWALPSNNWKNASGQGARDVGANLPKPLKSKSEGGNYVGIIYQLAKTSSGRLGSASSGARPGQASERNEVEREGVGISSEALAGRGPQETPRRPLASAQGEAGVVGADAHPVGGRRSLPVGQGAASRNAAFSDDFQDTLVSRLMEARRDVRETRRAAWEGA